MMMMMKRKKIMLICIFFFVFRSRKISSTGVFLRNRSVRIPKGTWWFNYNTWVRVLKPVALTAIEVFVC